MFSETLSKLKNLDQSTMLIEASTLIEIKENRIQFIKDSTLPFIVGERNQLKAEISELKELINNNK